LHKIYKFKPIDMKVQNISIAKRLRGSGLIIFILLLLTGLFTKLLLDTALMNYSLLTDTKSLLVAELEMRKAEKNFLAVEAFNEKFYVSGESENIVLFKKQFDNSIVLISSLKQNKEIINQGLLNDVMRIEQLYRGYLISFQDLVFSIKTKGYNNYGIIGKINTESHAIEKIIANNKDIKLQNYLLLLRKLEKDYMLQKDIKYSNDFNSSFNDFNEYIVNNLSGENKLILTSKLKNYKNSFNQLSDEDQTIGYQNNSGILNNLNEQVIEIERILENLEISIRTSSKQKINKSVLLLFGILLGISSIILFLLFNIASSVIKPLKNLKNHISQLGKGQLPADIYIDGKNEITDMAESLNILTYNLKNTREFAIEVGNGNLNTQIDVFNNEGDLGGSLIEMRKRLLKVYHEREIAHKKSEERLWTNDGLNKAAELLRHKDLDLNQLSSELLSFLIKWLNVNQGGIYVERKDGNEVYFDLVAAYAYGRKKYLNSSIKLGHDLIGTCAIEKENIILNDVPDDYINITSGLGTRNPNYIVIIPIKQEQKVVGVLEIASFNPIQDFEIQFLEKVSTNYASVLINIQQHLETQELLRQSDFQANELLAQEEELRQNLEELSATQEALSQNEERLKNKIKEIENKNKTQIENLNSEVLMLKEQNIIHLEYLKLISTNYMIGELSSTGDFISINEKVVETFEVDKMNLINSNIKDYILNTELSDFEIDWLYILQGNKRSSIYHFVNSNGKPIQLGINCSPIFSENKEIEKVIFIARKLNIKQRKFKEIDGLSN